MVDREPKGIPIDIEVPLPLLRGRLSRLTSRIIFKLEDRAGFALNHPVYEPGAIPLSDGSTSSFFEFAIKGLEDYHGLLGRWEFPDEYPLLDSTKSSTIARRKVGGLPVLPKVDINVKDLLLPYYVDGILPRICEHQDDPDTYGETVYIDADIVALVNERVNLGRYVAAAKAHDNPDLWKIVPDTDKLNHALRDYDRENVVIGQAKVEAAKVGLDVAFTGDLFRWVIERTTDIEVEYLQSLLSKNTK